MARTTSRQGRPRPAARDRAGRPEPRRHNARPQLHYGVLRTPLGELCVAATRDGVVKISLRARARLFAAQLQEQLRADPVRSDAALRPTFAELEAYFTGKRRRFGMPIDLRLATPFQRRVFAATRAVPYGEVVSYAEVARRIGTPSSQRAVGQALGHNPIPIVIPCHRVIAAGGELGGYTGGLDLKRKLLELEGARTGPADSRAQRPAVEQA